MRCVKNIHMRGSGDISDIYCKSNLKGHFGVVRGWPAGIHGRATLRALPCNVIRSLFQSLPPWFRYDFLISAPPDNISRPFPFCCVFFSLYIVLYLAGGVGWLARVGGHPSLYWWTQKETPISYSYSSQTVWLWAPQSHFLMHVMWPKSFKRNIKPLVLALLLWLFVCLLIGQRCCVCVLL